MIIVNPVRSVIGVSTTIDHVENATRYEIVLTFDPTLGTYTISLPGLGKSIVTTKPWNIAYKMREKKVLAGDAEAVQDIVSKFLLPRLNEQLSLKGAG